jgi:hypothetical protein
MKLPHWTKSIIFFYRGSTIKVVDHINLWGLYRKINNELVPCGLIRKHPGESRAKTRKKFMRALDRRPLGG